MSGVEANPGPQGFMFNADFRDAINKLKVETEQQKTEMEQQKAAMEQQKMEMEQKTKEVEQKMALLKKSIHAFICLVCLVLLCFVWFYKMEHQMEQKMMDLEQQITALEQHTKVVEQQMAQQKKTMEHRMEHLKTAMEQLTPAVKKRQLEAAFKKLSKEHPDTMHMQQAHAGSSGHRLLVACQLGEKSLVESLLNEFPVPRDKAEFINSRVDGWYALVLASDAGHADVVSLLITSGADVTVRGGDGWTGLMSASLLGHVSVVRVLLDLFTDDKKKADYVNIQLKAGASALSFATYNKHQDIINLLINNGAKRKT